MPRRTPGSLWRFYSVMNKWTVIVSGGTLKEEVVLPILKDENTEYLIGVDHGLSFLHAHRILPNVILGDFDSLAPEVLDYYEKETELPVYKFNPIKDATDTENAIRLAIEKGKKHILILGGTGTRLDHVWGNVQSLKIAKDAGVEAVLLDGNNRIRLLDKKTELKKAEAFGHYFSLFPLGGAVEHLCISGAKYPLTDHKLEPYDSLCVSNQIQEEKVIITYESGELVLMETRD